jgi:rhodanese-related sulfurtransferase
MTRILAVSSLLVIAVALVVAATPRISVDMAVYPFGSVIEGLAVEHTFLLSNTGDSELVISKIEVSCGCTTTNLATDRLAPGDSVELHAIVDTSGYSGEIRKSITVYSNDPSRSQLQLGFLGTVTAHQAYHETVGDLYYDFQILIDVRSADAFASAHLIGAMNIAPGDLQARATTLPTDIFAIVYDQNGQSVNNAVTTLERGGLTSVYALRGGLDLWTRTYGSSYSIAGQDASWGTFPAVSGGTRPANTAAVLPMEVSKLKGYFYILIDIRSPSAYAAGHLAGALNVQESQLNATLQTLPTGVPIYIYSQDGTDSDRVVSPLWQRGNLRVKSLLGGLDEWARQRGDENIVTSAG